MSEKFAFTIKSFRPRHERYSTHLCLSLSLIVSLHVDGELPLLRHQSREVDREPVRVIQPPRHVARQRVGVAQLVDGALQQAPAARQRLQELLLLLIDDVLHLERSKCSCR